MDSDMSMLIVYSGNTIYKLLSSRNIKVSSWILNNATLHNLIFSVWSNNFNKQSLN